jgi:hypothetical protein
MGYATQINDDDLKDMMYFLTLEERPQSREKWIQKGFKKVHARGEDALFQYWKNRIESDPKALQYVLDTVPIYKERRRLAELRDKKSEGEPLSMTQLAGSITKAAINWAKGGFATTDEQTLIKRIETCMGCEFWDAAAFRGTGRCKKCGCSTQAKLRMATEKCPIGKW